MMLTILIGGVSGLMSYAGYVLAAPNLQEIVDGGDPDPIPSILESSLGVVGSKIFLCIAITAFISCVLSPQAAGSRLLVRLRPRPDAPGKLLVGENVRATCCSSERAAGHGVIPILICLYVYADPNQLPRITAFAVLGIYIAFQAVVLRRCGSDQGDGNPPVTGTWARGANGSTSPR